MELRLRVVDHRFSGKNVIAKTSHYIRVLSTKANFQRVEEPQPLLPQFYFRFSFHLLAFLKCVVLANHWLFVYFKADFNKKNHLNPWENDSIQGLLLLCLDKYCLLPPPARDLVQWEDEISQSQIPEQGPLVVVALIIKKVPHKSLGEFTVLWSLWSWEEIKPLPQVFQPQNQQWRCAHWCNFRNLLSHNSYPERYLPVTAPNYSSSYNCFTKHLLTGPLLNKFLIISDQWIQMSLLNLKKCKLEHFVKAEPGFQVSMKSPLW